MKIFIGSSTESLPKAEDIAVIVESTGNEPCLWSTAGMFPLSGITFESLHAKATVVDAAIFIYAEDDKIWYRDDIEASMSVRDNVLIETGLFIGVLGRKKVVICKMGGPKIATDLWGITLADWNKPAKATVELKTWLKTVNATANLIDSAMVLTNYNNAIFKIAHANNCYETLKGYAISTSRVVQILEGYDVRFKNVKLLLRKYADIDDKYYSRDMDRAISVAIDKWNKMAQNGKIENLEILRFDYQPDSGFFVLDNKYALYGNLHFTLNPMSMTFDENAVLVENKNSTASKIIDWYSQKFDRIRSNFLRAT